jgi:hypothetical protein
MYNDKNNPLQIIIVYYLRVNNQWQSQGFQSGG